ncbi:hypothetical protein REPUB_Repub01dG0229000 [Reevesia pubescens]
MANSISKRRCISNEEERGTKIDSISNLPDSLLTHILSFLPTKDSVATSVLSKRWEYLWTLVPALSFGFFDYSEDDLPWFMDFVYRVLVLSKAQKIIKFSLRLMPDCSPVLRLSPKDECQLKTWISAAVGRGVQELELNVLASNVKVPSCLFACNSLVSLKLYNGLIFDVPASVHLPSLRILHLISLARYPTDDSLTRLFSGCPVLEELNLEIDLDDDIVVLNINVPSLKRITLQTINFGAGNPEYKLVINAPLLEKLDLRDRAPNFLIQDISSLVEAVIKVDERDEPDHNQQMFELLEKVANVRFLSLSSSTLLAAYTYKPKFPVFRNLIHLEVHFRWFLLNGVFAVLESSNNLKSLVLHSGNYQHICKSMRLPDSVPKCVSMCLKTFNFRGFKGAKCDLRLVRYILKNATFLKQMKIGISFNLKEQCHLLAELLTFPRTSKTCEVSFY